MERRRALLVAMAAAAGLGAAGAVAIVAGDGAGPPATTAAAPVTVTVARTETVPVTTEPAGIEVPALVGVRLDQATASLDALGLRRQIDGGGLLGVLDDTGWLVCSSDPAEGDRVPLGAVVIVHVERSCA